MRLLTLGLGTTPPQPPQNPPNPPSEHWEKFWSKWTKRSLIVFVVFYALIMGLTAFLTRDSGVQFWSLWFFVAGGHLWKGFRAINEQMCGVLIFFGLILEDLDSGPHMILWPTRIREETKNSIHVAFGTIDAKNRAQLEKAKKTEKSASWYIIEEPVRIKWGDKLSVGLTDADIAPYLNDPDANTITTDPHLYFRIRISSLRTLIEEVGGLEEAIERIKDTCIQALSEMAGKTFVALARKQLDKLSNDIRERVEYLVGDPQAIAKAVAEGKTPPRSWGIDIEQVAIRDIGLPHEVNSAAADRSAFIARSDGQATGRERLAETDRIEIIKKGEGEATVIKRKGKAERVKRTEEGKGTAAAITAVSKASDTSIGRFQLSLDATVRGLASNSKIIISQPGGATDLLGLVAAGQALLEKDTKTEPATTPAKTDTPSKP